MPMMLTPFLEAERKSPSSSEAVAFYTLVYKMGVQPSEVTQLNPLQKTVLLRQYEWEKEAERKEREKQNRQSGRKR